MSYKKPRQLRCGRDGAAVTYSCWETSDGVRCVSGFQWEPQTAKDLERLARWCEKAAAWLKEK